MDLNGSGRPREIWPRDSGVIQHLKRRRATETSRETREVGDGIILKGSLKLQDTAVDGEYALAGGRRTRWDWWC